uniref:Fatty acid hydroxylase domain-containing protein n=1 Tax=Ditylum brightwellii TaxID=49249 RepID=A0A6U3SBG0_9STRA|mmetsp:Transcript_31715/g.47279  ORF Transcript_31715/g.47279 Transcript_31715/m.47279 type:complete len:653 (+) Transcript_31715:106-2064(+)
MCQRPRIQEPEKVTLPVVPTVDKKAVAPTHSRERNTDYDLLFFLAPALMWWATPVFPIFATGIARVICTHLVLSLHYIFVDKDNYFNKISQKQLKREKDDYLVGTILHMWAQVGLQIVFPSMFFCEQSHIKTAAFHAFICHVLIVEPLYYTVHRWLHLIPQMKKMHGFHHLSINTLPSTSLVQNFHEHFVYIATFGPAFFVPWLFTFKMHWTIVGGYLVLFDAVNAWGHTNVRLRHPIWNHKYSPMRYLFYTPEFHLGHHAYFSANYGLFMPLWDHLLGTYRPYLKPDVKLAPPNKQDFVFIGHNGGLGHLLTCPEFSVYNVYEKYRRSFLPLEAEFLLMHILCLFAKLFIKSYRCSRFLVNNEKVARIICTVRSPWDFASPKSYAAMNREIVELIKDQYKSCGTQNFGLGNLNKMKQLNDGGAVIAEMVANDAYLKDKNIKVWTGDTMTSASVYNQILDIPDLTEFFYIGANGKIGTAVITKLLKSKPDLKIKIFSRYHGFQHPNVSYTDDLSEIKKYKVAVLGKILSPRYYDKAFAGSEPCETRFLLDYTVPFIPITAAKRRSENIQHIQIAVLQTHANNNFLRGSFDVCMAHDQNCIYPCHFGCIMNMVEGRQTNETGEVDPNDMDRLWNKAISYGFHNKIIGYSTPSC